MGIMVIVNEMQEYAAFCSKLNSEVAFQHKAKPVAADMNAAAFMPRFAQECSARSSGLCPLGKATLYPFPWADCPVWSRSS
jgi:hypothetical protein